MNSDNPNVSPVSVDASLYTRRTALEDDYHRKNVDLLAWNPMEYAYLGRLAKTFINLADKTN